MGKLKAITTTTGGVALLVVAIFCLNVIASRLFIRLDVTGDRVFSLSDGTRRILDKLDDDVTAKLYFSRSIKDLPVVVKTYATRVEEVLGEYAAHSKGHLTVEVIDPKPDTDEEEWAQKYGINGVRLPKGDQLFFGVVFVAGSREIVIPYLDPRREELLEYDLSEALVRTFRKEQTRIGILSSLSVMGGGQMAMMHGDGGESWVLVEDLQRNFKVEEVSPSVVEIPEGLKVLLVLHPKSLAPTAQYAIDQFLMRGGRLIVAVDPMSRVDLELNGRMASMSGQMPTASSDLDKLFQAWGIEYAKSALVGDQTLATQINAGGQVLAYPFFMSLGKAGLSKESVITSGLGQMLLAEAGAFSLKEGSSYKLEPLITTTRESGTVEGMKAMFSQPLELARELKADGKERVVAGLLRGKFKSAFDAAPPLPEAGEGQPKPERKQAHKAEADGEAAVLLIGDVDFLHDSNAADKFRFGSQVMVRARNDNLAFLSNAADFLGGSEDLISIRSRGRIQRPFTRVAEIQRDAQKRWQNEEDKLTQELEELQKKLSELQAQRTDGNRMVLSAQQQAEIANFRDAERKARQRRREVRKSLREDVEALGRRLMAANLLFVPVATSLFGVGVFVRRSRRTRTKEASHAK